jgi:hypothetical protein
MLPFAILPFVYYILIPGVGVTALSLYMWKVGIRPELPPIRDLRTLFETLWGEIQEQLWKPLSRALGSLKIGLKQSAEALGQSVITLIFCFGQILRYTLYVNQWGTHIISKVLDERLTPLWAWWLARNREIQLAFPPAGLTIVERTGILESNVADLTKRIAKIEATMPPFIPPEERITKSEATALISAATATALAAIDAVKQKYESDIAKLRDVDIAALTSTIAEAQKKIAEMNKTFTDELAKVREEISTEVTKITNAYKAAIDATREAVIEEIKTKIAAPIETKIDATATQVKTLDANVKAHSDAIELELKPKLALHDSELELIRPYKEALVDVQERALTADVAWTLTNVDTIRRIMERCGPWLDQYCMANKDLINLLSTMPFAAFIAFMTPYIEQYGPMVISTTLKSMSDIVNRGA